MLPSQINVTSVKLFSTATRGVDVLYVFHTLKIRESIVNQFVSGDITLVDDRNLYESIPIVGQEQIQITIESDSYEETIVGMVYKVGEFTKVDARRSKYTLYFVSMEYYFNQNNRVDRAFQNTAPHDIIDNIFNDDINTSKNIIIEEMDGQISYIAPNVTPFKTIKNILRQSVSVHNGTSNFLFFESRRGFIIASLASLLQQEPLYEYKYSEYIGEDNDETTEVTHDSFHIEVFNVIKQTNTFTAVANGMFASQLHNIDLITRQQGTNDSKYEFDYHTEFDSFKHLNNQPLYKKISGLSDNAEGKQYFAYTNEKSLNNDYVKSNQSDMSVDFSSTTRLRNSIQNNMIDAYVFKLAIPGNILLYPSNVINLTLTSNLTGDKDNVLSGNVMITNITHVISGGERTYKQVIETTKDSHINVIGDAGNA